jgi:hypothetical protein
MTPMAVFAAYPDMRMCPIDDGDERGARYVRTIILSQPIELKG